MEEIFLKNVVLGLLAKELEIWKKGEDEYLNIFSEISNNIRILDKYLLMVKNQKVTNHNVINFYNKHINQIIISVIEIIYDKFDINKAICKYKSDISKSRNKTIDYVKESKSYLVNLLNNKDNITGFNEVNEIKKIMSSIVNGTYYKNIDELNKLKEKIIKGKYDSLCETIILYLDNKYESYLKEEETNKNNTISNNGIFVKDKISIPNIKKEKYCFDKNKFFSSDDNEILKATREILYHNKNLIEGLNNISYKYIKNVVESNKEILLFDERKLENYKSLVIIYEINIYLNQIDELLNFILKYRISKETIEELIPNKDNIIFNLNELYNKWLDLKGIDELETDINKKDIIYINAPNNTPYFEIEVLNNNSTSNETYPSFVRMLDKIENGVITKNPSKDSRYKNHGLKNSILKKKDYKSRIQYVMIDNYVFIITGFVKNEWTSYNHQHLYNMDAIAYDQINSFLNLSLEDRNKIIGNNKVIHNQIKNDLLKNARGKNIKIKKNQKSFQTI